MVFLLWKIWKSVGWLFPIYGKIKHVPNHQPANVCISVYIYIYDAYEFTCNLMKPSIEIKLWEYHLHDDLTMIFTGWYSWVDYATSCDAGMHQFIRINFQLEVSILHIQSSTTLQWQKISVLRFKIQPFTNQSPNFAHLWVANEPPWLSAPGTWETGSLAFAAKAPVPLQRGGFGVGHGSTSNWWLVVYLPLWKIWVHQLGWLFPIYSGK